MRVPAISDFSMDESAVRQQLYALTCKPPQMSEAEVIVKKKIPEVKVEAEKLSPEELERRFQLIRSVGEECVTEDDLRNLLSKKSTFRLYDGFEPSGRMHIAQGIFKALNVNKCTSAGGTFVFWVADWFGLMNDKMGGDLDKIKVVGQYFIEVWKGAGMDLSNVEFRWASDDIINNAKEYWEQMLDITKRFTLARVKKCCQIMGRLENSLTAAQILYPLMQCTDVFHLKCDICQLGVDQRKVNMLAREYCDSIGRKLKPVILSHHMLYGLAKGQAKMSKSNPDSAIFLEDPEEEVERKMGIAYCPTVAEASEVTDEESMSLVEDALKNPCLDYVQYIVMNQPDARFKTALKTYTVYEDIRDDFLKGVLSEQELKKGIAQAVNKLLQPVRDHFENDPEAKRVLELVRQYKREPVSPPKKLRRMSKLFKQPHNCCVVFAPLPSTPSASFSDILNMEKTLKQAKETGLQVVLFIEDLCAIARDRLPGDKKISTVECLKVYYEMFIAALITTGVLEQGVTVLKQSETMLEDPSDYWLSVINVGRAFSLQTVLDAYENETQAGGVVSALMHVGNVLMLAPKKIFCVTPLQARLHKLACKYIDECKSMLDSIPPPLVVQVEAVCTITSAPDAATTVDLLLFDSNADVKKKLKQSFCEPGNIGSNPVLHLADALLFSRGKSLVLNRSPENGGIKEYLKLESLVEDFKSEQVHPGDLKSVVNAAVLESYASVDKQLKSAPKSRVAMESYIKRSSK